MTEFGEFIDQNFNNHVSIEYLISKGCTQFLTYNDPKIIKDLSHRKDITVYIISPDVSWYVREMTKSGMLQMGIMKIKSLGIINLLILSPIIIKNFHGVIKQDFKKILQVLVQIDYLEAKKINPSCLFLHYQVTDLALANNNKELIKHYLSSKKGVRGLMTKNQFLLERKLNEWNLKCSYILAPFNSKGFEMRESKNECEKMVSKNTIYFSFSKVSEDNIAAEKLYLKKIGIRTGFFISDC